MAAKLYDKCRLNGVIMKSPIASASAVIGAGFAGLTATAFANGPTDLFESLGIPGGRGRRN